MARRQRPEGARALHVHTLRALHVHPAHSLCAAWVCACACALHVCTRWLAGAALTARACGGGEST